MALDECLEDDARRAALPDGETPITIRLSFEVYSIQEEERIVTLLSWVGVNFISSTVVSNANGAGTNGDSPTPRA